MAYTTNHPSGNSHGGTAIIIKENIKQYLLEEYKTDKIQATSVRIHDNKVETTLSAIYCPPRHVTTSEDFKNYFKTLGNRYICGGDWNAKHVFWGSRLTSEDDNSIWLRMTLISIVSHMGSPHTGLQTQTRNLICLTSMLSKYPAQPIRRRRIHRPVIRPYTGYS
ncbi:RNA-directed DNA polymerase from mobile element jockey [Eumeta japonica]|uniref:RNA-directed DNA polymerase from mobile element jockey n=1 Tax=Eumeta variegata TaxID=151549 RepID=A0A4C1UAB2_EUMVA|nr:RNA-directed DNA polymerase from mobile element jockey [Eumeta japonica]